MKAEKGNISSKEFEELKKDLGENAGAAVFLLLILLLLAGVVAAG